MNQIFARAKLRIEKDKIIHVRRPLLLGGCDMKVALNQKVCPSDTLCQGALTSGYWVVQLARELKVNPKDAYKFLKRKIGQTIYQEELLAQKETPLGLGKKLLLAPVDGVIESYDEENGGLKIKMSSLAQKVPSAVYGVVDAIDPASGSAIIRTQATIIYGVLGFGKQKCGILKILKNESNLAGPGQISADMRDKIVVGGSMVISEALKKAESIGVAGLILGGVDVWDFKGMSEALSPTGLLVLEGFGSISIGEDVFPALKDFDGKYAILESSARCLILPSQDPNCLENIEKTAFPSKINAPAATEYVGELKIGARVRVISAPFWGVQGTVESIDETETLLPSKIKSTIVTIAAPKRKIREPYQNVEII